MAEPELLIDALYKQTFKKPPLGNPVLRAILEQSRRFVLDDAMAAFLVEMTYSAFTFKSWKKIYRALDEARHFSRLPHTHTWVEYSDEASARQFMDLRKRNKLNDHPNTQYSFDQVLESARGRRVGWLMCQHERSDTAFDCTQFFTRNSKEYGPIVDFGHCPYVWQTDDDPLPWRVVKPDYELRGFKTGSEFATAIHGYVRDNVGYRCATTGDYDEIQSALKLTGKLRYVWIFLSTINKIPFVGMREMRTAHGFIARTGRHPYLTHKIITLHVPAHDRYKLARAMVTAVLRRRAHMVRGHFRDDWRKPKGNKSLWIGEHVRGDASLGFVVHDYAVEHGDPE